MIRTGPATQVGQPADLACVPLGDPVRQTASMNQQREGLTHD